MRSTRTLAAALAVAVATIIAPAAQSQARDTHAPVPQQADMHASVALAAAAAKQQQDLRSPDARDAAADPLDDVTAAGGSSQRPAALVADVQPAATASSRDDGSGANGLGGIVAGLLVIGGLAVLYGRRGRRSQRLHANH